MAGTLHVVATPLGNLDDLSPRALRVLRSVAVIACEDTRRTSRLLARFDVGTPLVSCHKFNERERLAPVLGILEEGRDVALVSDGGTPGVSDPGSLLVEAAHGAGYRVSPVAGPSALAAILSVSGLPADRFVFEGFLPHRAGERRRRLKALAAEERTVVAFETPHRILAALDDLAEVLGERAVVLGRELTKLHETVLRGTPRQIATSLRGSDVKGEIVLAIAGAPPGGAPQAGPAAASFLGAWRDALRAEGGDRRRALRRVSRSLGIPRAEAYRRLAELGAGGEGDG